MLHYIDSLQHYNVYFDVASVVLMTMFFIVYLLKNRLHTNLTNTFQILLFFNFVCAILDVVTAFTIESEACLPWLNYLLNFIFFASSAALGYLFFRFNAVLLHRAKFVSGWGMWIATLPLCLQIILLATTPWTGLLYTFTYSGEYIHGPLYLCIYIVQVIYMVGCCVLIIRFRHAITTVQHIILWIFFLFISVGMILQAFIMPNTLTTYFTTSIAFIFIYMTIMMNDSYIRYDTGLLNDVAFYTVITEKFEYQPNFYVCMFKLHEYHKCIEVYGLQSTNAAMRILQKHMKRSEGYKNIYQIADDFYAVIINDSHSSAILSRRESKINSLFEWMYQPIKVGKSKINVNPTVVKLSCPNDASDYDSFRSLIDYIMENSEGMVKGKIISVADDLKKKFDDERNVTHAINNAIQNNTLQIYLQPIYSVEEKRIVSAEVLCRLIDDELGFIPPDVFIPIAEKMQMIHTLGIQVFRKACVFAKQSGIMNERGIRTLKINLSPIQCQRSETADELIDIAASYEVNMNMLELELTESTANENNSAIWDNMHKLKEAGANLALDDYGTGYSNLVSIIQLPFDYIKIDKSILWSYSKGENSILESVIPMMKKQGYKLVCEGVETEFQSNLLASMGCDYLQGYFYSKPLPKEEFVKFVENFNGKH